MEKFKKAFEENNIADILAIMNNVQRKKRIQHSNKKVVDRNNIAKYKNNILYTPLVSYVAAPTLVKFSYSGRPLVVPKKIRKDGKPYVELFGNLSGKPFEGVGCNNFVKIDSQVFYTISKVPLDTFMVGWWLVSERDRKTIKKVVVHGNKEHYKMIKQFF